MFSKRLLNKNVKDLFDYTQRYNCALISAELDSRSDEENQELTEALYTYIDAYGYDCVPTIGYWKYRGMKSYVPEKSCFVVGSSKVRDTYFVRELKSLRVRFKQESVLLSMLTPLGYSVAYFWNRDKTFERAGVITTSDIDSILEEALERGSAGYSELDGAKFVFSPEKIVRSWGKKNRYNVGRKYAKVLAASGLAKLTLMDKAVEALLADYDAWVLELEGNL
jgi:hypothetical protein